MNYQNKKQNQKHSRIKELSNFFKIFFKKKDRDIFLTEISNVIGYYENLNLISFEEKKMIKNIAFLEDKKISTIMTPRADLVAINHNSTLEEIKKIINSKGHTRIPVYKDHLDEILGFIHSKDLAKFLCEEHQDFTIHNILRKILFAPGSMKLLDLLLRMRMARVHVAIVLDEFGGVDGFVTIENIIEEIVGNIEDEHDNLSENSFFKIKQIDHNILQVGGRVEIEKIEEFFQSEITENKKDFKTISGLVMNLFKHIPEIGEEIERGGYKFKIIDSTNRCIKLVEIKKVF
jgi:CBS domain containing-hemolysin-like protein